MRSRPRHPDAITITGTAFDGAGAPIADTLLEIWRCRPGRPLRGPLGPRRPRDARLPRLRALRRGGRRWQFELVTLKPGPVRVSEGVVLAPHMDVTLFARGMLRHLVTRMYFGDEAQANAADPILARVPALRRETLIAQPTGNGYRFDIHLQGPAETVFFAV